MTRKLLVIALTIAAPGIFAQVKNFLPVPDQMLSNPTPEAWRMFSRTSDAQRCGPVKQLEKQNVNRPSAASSRGFGKGDTEAIPTVYEGVMCVNVDGGAVQALDATTGDVIRGYQRHAAAHPAGRGGAAQQGGRG